MSKTLKNLVLSEKEQVIRTYEASELRAPKAKGYLVATTRRLLFIGESDGALGSSVMHREVDITKVTGVNAFYNSKKSWGRLVGAVILAIIFFVLGHAFGVFYLGLLWPAYLVYKFFLSDAEMVLRISADGTGDSPIRFGSVDSGGMVNSILRMFGASGDSAFLAAVAGPGRDAYAIVREIGALVLDVQTLGEHALEKWSNSSRAVERPQPFSNAVDEENQFFAQQ